MTPKQQRFVQDCERLCRDAQTLTEFFGMPTIIDPDATGVCLKLVDGEGRLVGEMRYTLLDGTGSLNG